MTVPGPPAPVAAPTEGTALPAAAAGWQRLHPLSAVVRTGRAFVPVLFVLFSTLVTTGDRSDVLWHLGPAVLFAVAGLVSWLVTRWRVEDGALRVETGLFRRDSQRLPLARVQAIDIVRPGLARALGLAELRLRTAGDTGDAGRLAYLRIADAERVRAQLLALAHGVHPDTPAPPERPLFALPTGRLVASVLLSRPFGVLAAFLVALGGTAAFSVSAARALAGTMFVYLLLTLTVVWRRFNGGWHLQVAGAADGLRLRFGALETTAETIPAGRVQAVRRTDPVAWRWAPWSRLQIDVAGKVGRRQESQSQTQQLRDLVPAGTPAEVDALLELLVPGRPDQFVGAPARARWKSPLRYHWLGVDRNTAAVAVQGGRLTRRTVWVPLAKVQSLRLVQGPVQRRLGLATLHVDTAGRRVHASVRDRDRDDAEQLLAALSEACRVARRPLAESTR